MIFHGWDLGEGVTFDTARVVPLPPPGLARYCTWSWDRGHSLILTGPQFARVLIPLESEVTILWDPPFGHPVPAPLGGVLRVSHLSHGSHHAWPTRVSRSDRVDAARHAWDTFVLGVRGI